MRPIFNESFGEKKGLWVPRTVHGTHWKALSITYFACQRGSGSRAQCTRPTDRQHLHVLLNLKKKKKKRNAAWKRKSKCILKVRLDTTYFTENLKYCSKIIFKCVNNIVGPIFNEKVAKSEFCRSRKQCMDPLVCTVPCLFCWCEQCTDKQSKKKKMQSLKKEKKTKKRRKTQTPTFSSVSKRYLSMPLFKITRGSFGSPFQATF